MVKKIILTSVILITILAAHSLSADNVDVTISASKTTVSAEELFQLTLNISGNINNATIEDMGNLDQAVILQRIGNMSSIRIINGVRTTTYTYNYYAKISKEGEFIIGPFTIQSKNKTYSSNTLTIKVLPSNTKPFNETNENTDNQTTNSRTNITFDKSKNYLLEALTSKKEVYANEFFDTQVNLYQIVDFIRVRNYTRLSYPPVAWKEEIESDQSQITKVRKYNNVYMKREIQRDRVFITKPGTYTITPFTLQFYGLTSGGFFATQELINLQTKPLTIKVKPLPPGKPENFSGAIGSFTMTTTLKPETINIKKGATLTIILSGEGNFQNIEDINVSTNNSIELYSSKSDITTSNKLYKEKKWEILLVPSKPGDFDVQIDGFSFLDTNTGKYQTLDKKSYRLKVTGKAEQTTSDYYSEENVLDSKDIQLSKEEQNIRYITLKSGKRQSSSGFKTRFNLIITLYISLFTIVLLFILFKYLLYNKLSQFHIIRRKNAFKTFSQKMTAIKKDINKTDDNICIDCISNIIENYFIDKFNIDSVKFTLKDIKKKLGDNLNEDETKKLSDIIMQLDMIRFGGMETSKDHILKTLSEITDFIKKIDSYENKQ